MQTLAGIVENGPDPATDGVKGAALMLPVANTRAMQMRLDEIGSHIAAKVSKNIAIILLPSRSPEPNPVENIRQYLRGNRLSNRVFEDYEAILDAGCEAWNKPVAQPQTITSIGMRDWAHAGH